MESRHVVGLKGVSIGSLCEDLAWLEQLLLISSTIFLIPRFGKTHHLPLKQICGTPLPNPLLIRADWQDLSSWPPLVRWLLNHRHLSEVVDAGAR